MMVDVIINVRYDKTTPVGPGKNITTTENIAISDTVDEATVQAYITNMMPVALPPA